MTSLADLLAGDGFRNSRPRQTPPRPPLHPGTAGSKSLRGRDKSDFHSRRSQSTLLHRKSSFDTRSEGWRSRYNDRESDDESVDMFSDEIRGAEEEDQNRTRRARPSFRGDDVAGSSSDSPPALDDAAVHALAAILNGYIRRFFKDENFRASLRHSCLSWLESGKQSGVMANLEEAIGAIEQAATGSPDSRGIKRASLRLSVIAGLGSGESKEGYTSGIPNLHLSACAHIYLGLFYRIQKKDKVSAWHLLQVFCDAPNRARTALLPAMWDHLFFPNISHLKTWYEKEVALIAKTPSRLRKLQALENVYNNVLDEGTYEFAVYYKEWLTEDNRAPKLPDIDVPVICFSNLAPAEDSPRTLVADQPMVSKSFSDQVFSKSKRTIVRDEAKCVLEDVEEVDEEELEEEVEEEFTVVERSSEGIGQEDEGAGSETTKSVDHIEGTEEAYRPPDSDLPEWMDEDSHKQSSQDIHEEMEFAIEYENDRSQQNEFALKKLAQAVFQQQIRDKVTKEQPASRLQNIKEARTSAEPFGYHEDVEQGSSFSSIPTDFVCPLTGYVFKDPVTLETGQTLERAAIVEWFKQGNKTCPVTGRELKSLSIPDTNFVLRRVIDGWRSQHCRNLLVFGTQVAGNAVNDQESKDESALFIIEQLLSGSNIEEQMENAKHLVSLGGLHFLTQRLELGNLDEKFRIVWLLLCCIKADGSCRRFLSMNIKGPWILELLHSKKINARTSAVKLMIELICLNRRSAITSFLNGLHTEAIVNTMHLLLVYLQCSVPEDGALVAVLVLHLDLMVEHQRYSIYREEAVDGIIMALEYSLYDGKLVEASQKALLMLGGHFSSSGEILIETWLLKQAGFYTNTKNASCYDDDEGDGAISKEEEREREEWLNKVAPVLLSNGKRSLLETLSRCLSSENTDLVKVCLITIAWMSRALPSLSFAGFQLFEFSSLIPLLKEIMDNDKQLENRVLASASLLNFSEVPECKVLLKTFAKEMLIPLKSLVEVTWTAKLLYVAIFREN